MSEVLSALPSTPGEQPKAIGRMYNISRVSWKKRTKTSREGSSCIVFGVLLNGLGSQSYHYQP